MLFFAALVVPVSPAQAAYSMICTGSAGCAGQGYSDGGYSSHRGTSYWNMYTGTNCTNYVAYRLVTTNGMSTTRPKPGVGNAEDWGFAMSSITDTRPVPGSVAWWGRTGHHVAYVEKVVSSTEIWVSESNWSGAFDWRKITKSGSGWPDGFIHFADPKIVNSTKPVIYGTVKVGATLSSSGGSWTPKGNDYGFQWLADGKAIAGATKKTFTPTSAIAGKDLSLTVTATRTRFPSTRATSTAREVAPGRLTASRKPAITGTPRVDSKLTATPGTWSPSSPSFTYQWLVDGTKVDGATATTFTPGPDHVGRTVSIRVRAAKGGYEAVASTSAGTPAVAAGTIASTSRPTVTGTPRVGSTLTTTNGTWSRSGLSFAYQWFVSGARIDGATGPTYAPTAADLDGTITVRVTASRPGYTAITAASSPSGTITRGTLAVSTRPTVTGTPRVGSRLTATTGVWSANPAHSFQWYSDNQPIDGATDRTFLPSRGDLGTKIRVRVTARQDGYATASALSVNTTPLTSGHISVTTSPTITGDLLLDELLTIDGGTHTPSGASLRHQWLIDGVVLPGATGATHRVRADELGHRLSARVTMTAAAYTARTVTTASVGPAKSPAAISVTTVRPAKDKVTFTLKISAPSVPAPDGTITVRYASSRTATAKVVGGRATIALTGQVAGLRTYRFTFGGTSTVTSATASKTLTIG